MDDSKLRAVPGWKLVPIVPTEEMLGRLWLELGDHPCKQHALEAWEAALNAAPPAPISARDHWEQMTGRADARAAMQQEEMSMLKRQIHNLKRHIEDYCQPAAEQDKAGWIGVDERLPEVDVTVLVYAPPQVGDWPDSIRISFDCIDPNDDDHATWLSHNEHYEHFCCVAKPEGCVGPSEKAPYTHWMPLPAAPEAMP